jgi:hypothetical protein
MTENSSSAPPIAKTVNAPNQQVVSVQLWDPYPASYPNLGNMPPPIQVPLVCTCCLKPTTSRVDVRWGASSKSTVGASRVQTVEWARAEFFVCDECQKHEKDFLCRRGRFIRWVIFLASVLATALLFCFTDPSSPVEHQLLDFWVPLLLLILLPVVIAFVSVLLLDRFIRLPPLAPQHASRTKGVVMTGRRSFVFENLQYGLAFALANHAVKHEIHSSNRTDKMHGCALLEGKSRAIILFASIPLSIAATLILSLMVGMLLPGSGLNPWVPRIGIPVFFFYLLVAGSRETGGYIG